MNPKILTMICCPMCKGELDLRAFQKERVEQSLLRGETKHLEIVQTGILLCAHCNTWFPIHAYVPVMLIFETKFHRRFAQEHSQQLASFAGYKMPAGSPRPGERSVQATFTEEWDLVQQDELSFLYSMDDLKSLNRDVWLKWINESPDSINAVLEVGCGLYEPMALQSVLNGAEVFAIDLNFALLNAGESLRKNPSIHPIIASLFHLPFRSSSFDLVYSQGVIMATYSTLEAFKAIADHVRPGRYLFVWVYALDDRLVPGGAVGATARVLYAIEALLRPLVSFAPGVLRTPFFRAVAFLTHPVIRTRVRHKGKWRLRNTEHILRDWLSPRYAHRHSYNEVLEWFEDNGFRVVDVQSPRAYRKLFQKRVFGVGVTGKRLQP
jgi:uncharacterized protein YbaR (Trm112 family)